jgi:hypothetical protein
MADLLNKEQLEAEKDIAAWKELQASILQAIMETIKGLFPGAEVGKRARADGRKEKERSESKPGNRKAISFTI